MRLNRSYTGFLIHGVFLALAVSFTEINTVLPALIIQSGGSEVHIGILTTIMVGLPLVSRLLFSSFLQSRKRKKSYLLGGIYARMLAFYLIALLLFSSESFSSAAVLFLIYCGLIVFTMSGAFAGITYSSLIGSTISPKLRSRFFVRKQFFWSLGILVSGLCLRLIAGRTEGLFRYGILFTLAATMLALASIGFWLIHEKPEPPQKGKKQSIFRSLTHILTRDRTFRNYAVSANLLSSSIVMLPFYIKIFITEYRLDSAFIGNIVLLQIGGMIVSNLFWPRIIKPLGFKGVLKTQAILGALMPLCMVIFISAGMDFRIIYFIVPVLGAMNGAHKMSSEAVLVQISPDDKRSLYSGIFGALNLTSAVFPILAAALISAAGWKIIFVLVALLPLTSLIPISRMVCPIDIKKARESARNQIPG